VTVTAPSTPRPSARHFIVCADDFAIDAGAVEAIVELIERGRVTATSALVDAPHWRAAAAALPARPRGAAGPRGADIGLHLNLTQPFPAPGGTRAPQRWPLGELIVRCALRAIEPAVLQAEIERQLDAFEDAVGRRPDYIDGHQHVHQLAGVREALVTAVLQRYGTDAPWLRSTRPPEGVRGIKACGIAALGDRHLRALASGARLRVSRCLAGVYDFRAATGVERERYRQQLGRWLQLGPDGTVLMCHPATRAAADDPIGAARAMEYATLGSAEFGARLDAAGIALGTGSAWLDAQAGAAGARAVAPQSGAGGGGTP
jgi:predicted glycoside hydrolase/deacetylase ChbG (UPF0249 family)